MTKFNFKRRNLTSGPHLLGSIAILSGLVVIALPYFVTVATPIEKITMVGGVSILIGLFIILSYEGTLIDPNKRQIKEYTSIAGIPLGKWEVLPSIQLIKTVAVSYKSTNTPNGISPTLSSEVREVRVLLFTDDIKPIFSFSYSSEKKAVHQARQLATALKVDFESDINE